VPTAFFRIWRPTRSPAARPALRVVQRSAAWHVPARARRERGVRLLEGAWSGSTRRWGPRPRRPGERARRRPDHRDRTLRERRPVRSWVGSAACSASISRCSASATPGRFQRRPGRGAALGADDDLDGSGPRSRGRTKERKELAASAEHKRLVEEFPAGVHGRPRGGREPGVLLIWTYDIEPVEPTFPIEFDRAYGEICLRGMSRMIPALAEYLTRLPRAFVGRRLLHEGPARTACWRARCRSRAPTCSVRSPATGSCPRTAPRTSWPTT